MRCAPAVQIDVDRAGVWRAGVVLLMLAAGAALAGWLASRGPLARAWMGALGAAAGLVAMGGAASLLVPLSATLRWDGQHWQFGPVAGRNAEPLTGDVRVAFDFGAWMLLRFCAAGASKPWQARWLAVGRRGREADWRALRRAVYSPRPNPGALAGSGHLAALEPRPFPHE